MTGAPYEALLQLDSLSKLLRFLERELHWPISSENVEDVTFQYEPEEVGLKPEYAPKIKAIYQIRPPSRDTPWGIFFIDFENKRLPVTLMRRILNRLRVKKTGTSVGSGWNAADLLFMTTYGEQIEGMREVAFAHFHEQPGDLPTLNVLQWDAQDTPAKLERTYGDLRHNLGWPSDSGNKAAWREQWSRLFRHGVGHTVKTSKSLAEALADLSKRIRRRVGEILEAESETGQMTKLYKAFQSGLIHDLKPADFADTFAQTITYGLFSAAVSRRYPEEKGSKSLTTDTVSQIIPETSPFLREVLETFIDVGGRKKGIDFDELGVQEVVELLRSDETDMASVLADFGNRRQGEDPVIHFYEDYLKAYNKELKVKRGVFYTPQPVVSYIVRSVHELLQTEFGIMDGLASTVTWGEMAKKNPEIKIPEGTSPDSHFVIILDPATGTATFLVEVIDVIHRCLLAKWNSDQASCLSLLRVTGPTSHTTFTDFWNAYVFDHLLTRLYGYELMMAPYAIAHLKVGLKLRDTGFDFSHLKATDRVRIYLTNALEPATELQTRLALDWEALAHEAQAVKAVKETERFTVIIGNPPYANFGRQNKNPFILTLLEDFKRGLDERKINLDDDFIKFFRLYKFLADAAGTGILGVITNNVYLGGLTHRQMRREILETWPQLRFMDLHGDSRRQDSSPDGSKDENVFDIQQGVAISIAVVHGPEYVSYAGLWGSRAVKYTILGDSRFAGFTRLDPVLKPSYYFVPRGVEGLDAYQNFLSVNNQFRISTQGIQTKQDDFAIGDTEQNIRLMVMDLVELSENEIVAKYGVPAETPSWSVRRAKADVTKPGGRTIKIQIRPFDGRWTYFTGRSSGLLARPRGNAMRSMIQGNIALVTKRQSKESVWSNAFVVNSPVNEGLFSIDPLGRESIFPLWDTELSNSLVLHENRSNLTEAFLADTHLDASDAFSYIYAILHSPSYRLRYAEFLKIDFPRIPLPGRAEVFDALVPLGAELIPLHLMESPRLDWPMTTFSGPSEPRVEKVSYSQDTVWIDKAQSVGFRGVPEEVWNFHIGGYQVCEKWLKDRGPKKGNPGRILSSDDITHYQKIVVALSETIRIMKEIDEVIEAHGGWPDAFHLNRSDQ